MFATSGIGGLSAQQITALNRLNELSAAIAQSTKRLSTLKRINSARDDPAGLVHASLYESDLAAAESALEGVTRANAMLAIADSAAKQVIDQLQLARGLALSAADNTLSSEEVAANQIALDAIIDSINRLSQTRFGSRRLLDGSASFSTSGVDTTAIRDVNVLKKVTGEDITINIDVTQQAAQATDSYDNSTPLAQDATLVVTGSRGTTTITLSAGASTQDIADAFNDASYLTGISASVNGSNVDLTSDEYGSDAKIAIEVTEGSFTTAAGNSAQGTDAVATVNGQQITARGTALNVVTPTYSAQILLDPSASGALSAFTISGEGLQFVVGSSPSDTARFGLPRLTSASLGSVSGRLDTVRSSGPNSLTSGNASTAIQIIDDAISEAVQARASIGAFQRYTLDVANATLSSTIENTSAALSSIQDVDVGFETALLSNNQLLQQTAFEALTISNLTRNNVLDLLRAVTFGF